MTKDYTISHVASTSDYTMLSLSAADGLPLDHLPGQYVTLSAVRGRYSSPTKCFSITSAPGSKQLEVALRSIGRTTQTLASMKIGQKVQVRGPFGDFTTPGDGTPVVLLSNGIGITPFVSMVRSARQSQSQPNITLLAAVSSLSALPYQAELRETAANTPSITVDFFSGKPEVGAFHGRIDRQIISRLVATRPADCQYYICGNEVFCKQSIAALLDSGVNQDNIHTESFAQAAQTSSGKQVINRTVWGSLVGAAAIFAMLFGGIYIKTNRDSLSAAFRFDEKAARPITATQDHSAPTPTDQSPSASTSADNTTQSTSRDAAQPTQTYGSPYSTRFSSPSSTAS